MNGTATTHPVRGHRVSWEIHNGPIPEGMSVLHKCDNTICTNPEHLYLGTQTQNMQDAWDRGRRKSPREVTADGKIYCKKGHEKKLLPTLNKDGTQKTDCLLCRKEWSTKALKKKRG